MSHEWGNYPEDFTPKMYWGARAILERESCQPGKALYLLPDCQNFERLDGSQRDQDTFMDWINKEVLPELRRHAREFWFLCCTASVVPFFCKDRIKARYSLL